MPVRLSEVDRQQGDLEAATAFREKLAGLREIAASKYDRHIDLLDAGIARREEAITGLKAAPVKEIEP